MIAALFVAKGGCYFGLPNVDPWDEARDARLYAGPWPVVAHPPCARWCRLAGLVEKMHGKKRGQDEGCFASALESVRRFGGVLEHPAHSQAWSTFGLPMPAKQGWYGSLLCAGWATEVSQAVYGHPAEKLTWLYYVGEAEPPVLNWSRSKNITGCVSTSRRVNGSLKEIPRRLRSATPIAFRDVLISIAESARR